MMKNRFLTLMLLTILCLLMGACGGADPEIQVGGEIPSFTLPALEGGEVTSQSLEGKPVILNFWATWCGPCVKEIPTLQKIARGSDAQVVSIALDDEGESVVRPFVEKHGIEYTVLMGDMRLFERFDGYAIPYTLVLDASSKVVNVYRGLVSLRRLEKDLQKAKAAESA